MEKKSARYFRKNDYIIADFLLRHQDLELSDLSDTSQKENITPSKMSKFLRNLCTHVGWEFGEVDTPEYVYFKEALEEKNAEYGVLIGINRERFAPAFISCSSSKLSREDYMKEAFKAVNCIFEAYIGHKLLENVNSTLESSQIEPVLSHEHLESASEIQALVNA